MKYGKFIIDSHYNNLTLDELDSEAIYTENNLAIAILNKFNTEINSKVSDIIDKYENGLDEKGEWIYSKHDILEVLSIIENDEYEWCEREKDVLVIDVWNEDNHIHNHCVKISRKRGLFEMDINHSLYGEYHKNVKLNTNHIGTAKKNAIKELKKLILLDEIELCVC